MASENETVYIVDDDPSVREALWSLLRANGKNVQLFASGKEFLGAERRDAAACLILDLKMPAMNGLEVQSLVSAQVSIPIIFITGRGDIPSTVKAMKGGAIDFLTKPVNEKDLLQAIDSALNRDRESRHNRAELAELEGRYAALTPREREVLPLVVSGLLNKQAAAELGISQVTFQIHRSNVMHKMKARSVAELVRMAERLNIRASSA